MLRSAYSPTKGLAIVLDSMDRAREQRGAEPASDPLEELGRQWAENNDAMIATNEAGDAHAVSRHSTRAQELEDEIASLVPTSMAGVLVQAKLDEYLCAFVGDSAHRLRTTLAKNVVAYLTNTKLIELSAISDVGVSHDLWSASTLAILARAVAAFESDDAPAPAAVHRPLAAFGARKLSPAEGRLVATLLWVVGRDQFEEWLRLSDAEPNAAVERD
jgi:hypothetical protein